MTGFAAVASMNNRSVLDSAISDLKAGSGRLQLMSIGQRRALVDRCVPRVAGIARTWVATACAAKRISSEQCGVAEEILGGPGTLLRYLQLLSHVFHDIERFETPRLPGKPRRNSRGRICVPILPVRSLFDQVAFWGLKAEVWLEQDADGESLFTEQRAVRDPAKARVAGVLGAGNVSVIPATDMLYKIFQDNEAVLLKLNPVNEYLEPIFTDAFRPLIDAKLLRLIRGGSEIGNALVNHPGIDSLHITGSKHTHDAIVWGPDAEERTRRRREGNPLVTKPITSELGNVTPWVVVPGNYSQRELRSQAEHVVASIVNNASFNCLSTRMIVTSKAWPQRNEFLELVETLLKAVPARVAYYPGARERFEIATGRTAPDTDDDTLPWTLIRNVNLEASPHLFQEESFVCVCAETTIDEPSDVRFLAKAVDFVNEHLFGTLCATLTVSNEFRRDRRIDLENALARMRYGSVCINQWSGVVYGLMTPPWGAHPSEKIGSTQSGIGHVHNTFQLTNFDKTVMWGPLCNFPKPVWLPSHRTGREIGWALARFYQQPSIRRIPSLLFHSLRG